MDLRGWEYTGRNIGSDLHRQFRIMIDCLSDPLFTNHSTWGNDIQDRLAKQMQMSSSGAVRTVKRVCANFSFLNETSFSSRNEIDTKKLLTNTGKLVYQAAALEEQVGLADNYDNTVKDKIYNEINKLYEEAYCDALRFYYFKNSDGSKLHPLRATLRALNKYGCMDKWEWYLLNTYIRHDDCDAEEAALDDRITRYRNGEYDFTMSNVIENPKGHQYTPQYFEFAGLLHVVQRPEWSISDSGLHTEVKSEVLEADFLEKLYGGSLSVMDNNRIYSTMDKLSRLLGYTAPERSDAVTAHDEIDLDNCDRKEGGTNVLLYGVPGSGKSWTIEHEYCHIGSVVERIVFHPDYTNADFVGQILPVVDSDKQVTYEFTPGPFTTILREAYFHPLCEYILIIEEINRGNAPAIFGEIFQLLDRTVETKVIDGVTYPVGTSEYGVAHKYMAEKIYGNPAHKVRIPSNLSIVGTMNTSDQNVFTLDTAFQRRWRMRLIENNFDNVRASLANAQILDTEVTWKTFCEKINGIIVGSKAKMASAEDKRLGVYFVHESDVTFDQRAVPSEGYTSLLTEYNDLLHYATDDMPEDKKQRLAIIREALMHNRMFPEKVIKYLWEDAFKFNPEALFDTENMDSLEQVIRTFVYSTGRDRFKIFKPTVRASLYPDTQV